MEQYSLQISDHSAATCLLEKILSQKCNLHRQFTCEYLHMRPYDYSPRFCIQCMEDRNIPANEFVSIKLLLQASSSTTFNAYPKLNDNSITQKIQLYKGTSDKVYQDLSTFFDNLKSTISQTIEKQKSDQKDKLAFLSSSYQGIFDSLAQISQVEKLQTLVKNDNDNQLKDFINSQYSSADTYTYSINNKLLEYQKIYEGFSLSDPQNKLDQIVKLIEKIEFFPTIFQSQVNNSQQQHQQPQQIQNQQQQQVQQIPNQESTTIRNVYSEYVSLVGQGIEKEIFDWRSSGSEWEWRGPPLEWWKRSLWSYAKTYEEWLDFSEELRQAQLKILREEVGPSK